MTRDDVFQASCVGACAGRSADPNCNCCGAPSKQVVVSLWWSGISVGSNSCLLSGCQSNTECWLVTHTGETLLSLHAPTCSLCRIQLRVRYCRPSWNSVRDMIACMQEAGRARITCVASGEGWWDQRHSHMGIFCMLVRCSSNCVPTLKIPMP